MSTYQAEKFIFSLSSRTDHTLSLIIFNKTCPTFQNSQLFSSVAQTISIFSLIKVRRELQMWMDRDMGFVFFPNLQPKHLVHRRHLNACWMNYSCFGMPTCWDWFILRTQIYLFLFIRQDKLYRNDELLLDKNADRAVVSHSHYMSNSKSVGEYSSVTQESVFLNIHFHDHHDKKWDYGKLHSGLKASLEVINVLYSDFFCSRKP